MVAKICTCTWTPPNPQGVDPPFIEHRDPGCQIHGWRAVELTPEDEDYETDAEDQERKMPW